MTLQTNHPFPAANLVPTWLVENMQAATVSTFGKMVGTTTYLDPKENNEDSHYDGVIGIISFVGDLTWSMVLGLPRQSAEAVAKKFAGFDIPFDSADMGDVIGELTNVLAGVICGELENKNLKMQMSLPTVARGKDFQMSLPENLVAQRLHFNTIDSDFWIKLIVSKHM
jgi:CheY-specific phosphatase CheX